MSEPVFFDKNAEALWTIAPILFVGAGVLTVSKLGSLAAMAPFLIGWALTLAFVIYAWRQPSISVSIAESTANVNKRWINRSEQTAIPLHLLGPAVVVDTGPAAEGPRYEAAFTLPDGRKVVFGSSSDFGDITEHVERFRSQVQASRATGR